MRFLLKAFAAMLFLGVLCLGVSVAGLWAGYAWLQDRLLQETPLDLQQPTQTEPNVEQIQQQLSEGKPLSLSAEDLEAILWQQSNDNIYGLDIQITDNDSLELLYTLIVQDETDVASEPSYFNVNLVVRDDTSDSSKQQIIVERFSLGTLEVSQLMEEYFNTTQLASDEIGGIIQKNLDLNEPLADVASVRIQDQRLQIHFVEEKGRPAQLPSELTDSSDHGEHLPDEDGAHEKIE